VIDDVDDLFDLLRLFDPRVRHDVLELQQVLDRRVGVAYPPPGKGLHGDKADVVFSGQGDQFVRRLVRDKIEGKTVFIYHSSIDASKMRVRSALLIGRGLPTNSRCCFQPPSIISGTSASV
jgi:hypothetical protein